MDTAWAFREAYEHARKIKEAQDNFCAKATRGDWAGLGDYPEDLQWEALVDVLRGRVKVSAYPNVSPCRKLTRDRFIRIVTRLLTWTISSG